MTTIVASPPTFQSLPRLGWDGPSNNHQAGFSAMSSDDVSRMFMPQRKVATRSSSSSSLASNASASSTSSTSTVTSANDLAHSTNGESVGPAKKKQRGGFWPVSKAEITASVSNAKANGAVQPAVPNGANMLGQKNSLQPAMPEHAANAVNGMESRPRQQPLLVLLPMNGTFERKQINVPMHPDAPQKIGRQTNNKTTPKADNGYFDSKVLSRQHAEIWSDINGRVWIRDVKSSNGTFVNGTRLSPENRESEPTELRQHDSLELGIDIVSEDQKTIVHHKVSAKVEFVGFPGKAGNALDLLNFGELDPAQSNNLLSSPISAPMAHQRSQQGRPLTARGSVASSVTGGNVSSVAQRQANYWGAPLNIEQLVKQVGIEMRAAKQQSQDLEQARSFLTAILPADGGPVKLPPGRDHISPLRQANGRAKPSRVDHSARFADPPAPPPQQPLPEKPDNTKASSPGSATMSHMLKRETTMKPLVNGTAASPIGGQSQIVSLLESLDAARKQIESQGSKVRELEDMLQRERLAREAAEDKIKRLEESHNARPVSVVEEQLTTPGEHLPAQQDQVRSEKEAEAEMRLQQRIEAMLSEMQVMQQNLTQATHRAETAESEKSTLAAMIDKYRKQRQDEDSQSSAVEDDGNDVEEILRSESDFDQLSTAIQDNKQANGHVRTPRLPEDLRQAVSTMLQQQQANGETLGNYGPYMSMTCVVLIGVGIMVYFNSWPQVDK
ncbi:hypothetical protein LTR64_004040 [Lithohypha guttulata]|uniref:uncharacterized protein n=1 Tax=Lithohypha guttulata TaxID=1690604 RepID=UPI002DDFF587|nr:hypothetical protein LTR51_006666 [Lithohypha guttulata]